MNGALLTQHRIQWDEDLFRTDATALRLEWFIYSFTQRSRSGNVGLEDATALRLQRITEVP